MLSASKVTRGWMPGDKRRRRFTQRGSINAPREKKSTRVRHILEELHAEGWDKVWDKRTLTFVALTEADYMERFDRGTDVTNAEILETLVTWGISKMAWLGNVASTDEQGKKVKPFLAHAETAREFDDKRHRIDSVVTIKVGKETQKKYPEIENGQLEFGLDVTTWRKPETLAGQVADEEELEYFAEKISRSNNEGPSYQTPVPFGFSQIDFYLNPWEMDENDKRLRECKEVVPRFVIGVHGKIADAIMREDFKFDVRKGKFEPKDEKAVQNDVKTAMVGMKVMLEIRAQAELLLRMLPSDEDCVPEEVKLTVIRDKMNTGLKHNVEQVAGLMKKQGVLPRDIEKQIDGASREKAVEILAEMFRDADRGASGAKRSLKEGMKGQGAEMVFDPTFAGIMRAVENLKLCAESPKSKELKKLQARNKAVVWKHGRVHPLEFE